MLRNVNLLLTEDQYQALKKLAEDQGRSMRAQAMQYVRAGILKDETNG